MGRGIKKISENVIADKRSLTLVTKSDTMYAADPAPVGVMNTPAMPLGMLNVDYGARGLSVKVAQGSNDAQATWSRLDAKNTLLEQSIITGLIKDSAITTIKLADRNVTTPKIQDSAVVTSKLADLSVTEPKIGTQAVSTDKIATQAVTTDKIRNENVTTGKLAFKAVTTEKIMDSAVTTEKIANRNVTSDKLGDAAVIERTIGTSAVTTDKIMDDAVTSEKIKDETIQANNIAVGGVSNANLQDGSVSTKKLQDLCVTNSKIDNGCIIAQDKIMPGTITQELLNGRLFDMIDRMVLHDGNGNITGENRSSEIDNIKVTGDIYARRVYNVVYMDIAEGYIPGEDLEAGDIVAMHEDGKVYKAVSINDCIVGVVSDEFAQCFGASEEELLNGSKVAVGMIGKIHVKVKGPTRLGQRISIAPFDAGVGCANWMNNNNIGQVLESVDCRHDEIHMVLVQVRPM